MKIVMNAIEINELDSYLSDNKLPFAICATGEEEISKKIKNCLEKYYDKVVDKRGWISYYCNIINAWKCKDMGYESIEFSDEVEEVIKDFNLEKNESVQDKYVVVPYFNSGKKMDSISMVKLIRLDVEELKGKIND